MSKGEECVPNAGISDMVARRGHATQALSRLPWMELVTTRGFESLLLLKTCYWPGIGLSTWLVLSQFTPTINLKIDTI